MRKLIKIVLFATFFIHTSCSLWIKKDDKLSQSDVIAPLTEPNPAYSVELDALIQRDVTGGLYFGLNSSHQLNDEELSQLKEFFKLRSTHANEKSQKRIQQVVQHLKKEEFSKIVNYSVDEIIKASSKLTDSKNIEIAQMLSDDATCYSAELTLSYGAVEEKEFPDERAMNNVAKLYEKTFDCGEGETKARAAYRLGLFHVMRNECQKSLKYWDIVSSTPDVKFLFSRAAYWRNQCALDEEQRKIAALNFYQTYPLSYHSVRALKEAKEDIGPTIFSRRQPKVLVRSEVEPKANQLVDEIEKRIHNNEFAKAKEMLNWFGDDRAQNLEPHFRLYLAYLAFMCHDGLSVFQFLAKVLVTYPELKTVSTLSLFYPKWYYDLVETEAQKYGLDPLLVISLVRQESAFNKEAMSRVGARGLMQLMPATAKTLNRKIRKNELFIPEKNLQLGVQYFANLVKRYNGNVTFALAAYNAGFGAVDKWIERYKVDNEMLFSDLIPYRETREYVASILRNYYWYQLLDQYNHSIAHKSVVVGELDQSL